jgi:FMN phosphatase YigB (HAD superfamily)
VTFDCYGTLVDWQGGLGHLLAPIAGARATEVVEAFAGCQLALEKQGPCPAAQAGAEGRAAVRGR